MRTRLVEAPRRTRRSRPSKEDLLETTPYGLVARLQAQAGNRAVGRLLQGAHLSAGPAGLASPAMGELLAPVKLRPPMCGVSDDVGGEEARAAVDAATEEELLPDEGAIELAEKRRPEQQGTRRPERLETRPHRPDRPRTDHRRPHAGSATIVCDGKGGYRVALNSWAGAPCGTEGCVTKHELQHAADWQGRWPNGCKNDDGTPKPDGGDIPLGGAGYDAFLKKSECDAHTVDLACADALVASAAGDCKAKTKTYADLTREQRKAWC